MVSPLAPGGESWPRGSGRETRVGRAIDKGAMREVKNLYSCAQTDEPDPARGAASSADIMAKRPYAKFARKTHSNDVRGAQMSATRRANQFRPIVPEKVHIQRAIHTASATRAPRLNALVGLVQRPGARGRARRTRGALLKTRHVWWWGGVTSENTSISAWFSRS